MPNLVLNDRFIPRSSELSLKGDSKYLWLINNYLSPEEKLLAEKVLPVPDSILPCIKIGDRFGINIAAIMSEGLESLHCMAAIILSDFTRSASLSEEKGASLRPVLDELGSRLAGYSDPHRMAQSFMAARDLYTTYGIHVPGSIAYHTQPLVRVQNLIASHLESVTDTASINTKMENHKRKYASSIPSHVTRTLGTLGVFFEPTPYDRSFWNTHSELPMVPCMRPGSDWDLYTQIAGSPLSSDGRISKISSSLSSKYHTTFDVDLALRVAAQCYRRSQRALDLFIITLAIPDSVANEFIALVKSLVHSLPDRYQSGFSPATLFGITGEAARATLCDRDATKLPPNLSGDINIMSRDFKMISSHMYPHSGSIITVASQSVLALNAPTILRAAGIVAA